MLIAGIDTGTATMGYCRFDTKSKRFVGIGALALPKAEGVKKTDDYADRCATMAAAIGPQLHGCEQIIVERMSFGGGVASMVPIAASFGMTLGIASMMATVLYTVSPQVWQRAVLPGSGKKVDYASLEAVVSGYVRSDPSAAIALDSIAPKIRNHALDACGIALTGAFCLHLCRKVKPR